MSASQNPNSPRPTLTNRLSGSSHHANESIAPGVEIQSGWHLGEAIVQHRFPLALGYSKTRSQKTEAESIIAPLSSSQLLPIKI